MCHAGSFPEAVGVDAFGVAPALASTEPSTEGRRVCQGHGLLAA